jgi:acetolactate synthase-1/2/3 large subunit
MNNADLIVNILKSTGIRHGFGVPSGNVLPLLEAMRTGGIAFVLTAHEGSAAFSADVTGRLTGTPGLCLSTLGPGATNLTTGVGSAWLDRSPLIAITCTLSEAQMGRRLQMWIDHHALFKPITKASISLKKGEIVPALSQALSIALSEPPGPVHLDLPEDVAQASANETAELTLNPVPLPHAPEASIARAGSLLRSSSRPIAVIGASAMRIKDPRSLCAFVERHRIPFITTLMAKGMIEEDHPLSIGCIERAMRQIQRELIRSADLIIGIGYDTVEVEYEAWVGGVPVVHVGTERADVDADVRIAHEVVGHLDTSIACMAGLPSALNEWSARSVNEHRERFQKSLRPETARFAPHQAIDTIRKVLPREGVLAFDVGAHTHQIGSQWLAYTPRTFLVTNGWSSMGFGIPAAIAAKLAHPDLPVVCVLGDGCFQMTCGEVAVAKRQQLAIPIIILNDRWLSLIKVKQERQGLAYYGTEVSSDEHLETPAHYFGVPAVGVDSDAGLEAALRKALSTDGPTIIEASVDAAHYSETVYD